MAKKDEKKWMVIGLVVVALLIGGYFVFQPKEATQGTTKVGSDIPASDVAGVCKAREGVQVGMCCTKIVNGKEAPIDCEDMIQPMPPAQAFFQLGSGSRLANLPSVYFMVRAENKGNFDTRVRVSSIEVNASQGGDPEAINRIKLGFETLKSQGWKPAAKGAKVDFGMTFDNRIILDVPGTYQMADGTYSIKIKTEAEDAGGVPVPAGETAIQIFVQQEVVSFNVDVQQA